MSKLTEKLLEYSKMNYYPFHMPGHKRNTDNVMLQAFSDIYRIDITEIDGFDNLHEAEGILYECEQKAAKLFDSEETHYIVNGSTAGLLSAISAVYEQSGRKKKLLMARNCHKAAYHAIFLNGMEVDYIYPEWIKEYGILGEIVVDDVEKLLKKDEYCGFLLTSPTYDGICSDITKIAELVHKYHIPLIVDEAHGAYFGLSDKVPQSAVKMGADLVIQSMHKTLPAMTQTALIHLNGNLIHRDLVKKYLSIYQTSSPSYVMMASMDNCVELLQRNKQELIDNLMSLRELFEAQTRSLKHIKIADTIVTRDARNVLEPGKLILSVKGTSYTGQQLYKELLEKYHIQLEMCSDTYALAMLSMMDKKDGILRLASALQEIDQLIKDKAMNAEQEIADAAQELLKNMEVVTDCSIKDAWISDEDSIERVDIKDAEGKMSASFLYLYPPGIPILAPGEQITKQIMECIEMYQNSGLIIHGLQRNQVSIVKKFLLF